MTKNWLCLKCGGVHETQSFKCPFCASYRRVYRGGLTLREAIVPALKLTATSRSESFLAYFLTFLTAIAVSTGVATGNILIIPFCVPIMMSPLLLLGYFYVRFMTSSSEPAPAEKRRWLELVEELGRLVKPAELEEAVSELRRRVEERAVRRALLRK